MSRNIDFLHYSNNTTFTIHFNENESIKEYQKTIEDNNIIFNDVYFFYDFTIINIYKPLPISIQNIVIMSKNSFTYKSNTKNKDTSDIFNDETSTYLSLLQKYPDLIAFIIILKTHNIEYISLYLDKYKKKNIFNIIKNNQQEIIDMLEKHSKFINFYIRTCNINIFEYILNYNNNVIISSIETLFPDVPLENIEELIDIFS